MQKKIYIWQIMDATLHSYSQVYFSKNKVFAIILLLTTFFDPFIGIGGLGAVVLTNLIAYFSGFEKQYITDGLYGFNSLLVGLGLSAFYEPGLPFYFLLAVASLMTFLLTIATAGVFGKYGLPYLSVPFLLAIWVLVLASRNFEALGISERGVYLLNELYAKGNHWLVQAYQHLNNDFFPGFLDTYLKSLGAIFFQYNILSGILIGIGLIIYSRIALILSLITFGAAYLFYHFIGADITDLSYTYIGFNFILMAIAVGGFFMLPSLWSFVWVILLVPVSVILITATSGLLSYFNLAIYSLPFNLVVITFLYAMKLRMYRREPKEVNYQYYNPEVNLYSHLVYAGRTAQPGKVNIGLPFFGEWIITQGHQGEVTHLDAWRHAWDFMIRDENGFYYKENGDYPGEYYCYDKTVVAPADGVVENIQDHIPDNIIGDTNLRQNWGNSIVLRHDYQLYSQLSHLKPGSFKVKPGDFVKQGDEIARCGNSGRSPYPHLHFQLQSTPVIGAPTLEYPISYYLSKNQDEMTFKSFEFPKKDELISPVQTNDLLKSAFNLIPGKKLSYHVEKKGKPIFPLLWEVKTDILNNSYLYCHHSGSRAYFFNDGTMFYFTHFEGSRKSMLYYFFLGAYKVLLSYNPGIQVKDKYPLHLFSIRPLRVIQDFVAPFFRFMQGKYLLQIQSQDEGLHAGKIFLNSEATYQVFNKTIKRIRFSISIQGDRITGFNIIFPHKTWQAVWKD